MTSLAENIIEEAAKEAPDSPALQAASAAAETAANPSPESIMADVAVVLNIFKEIRTRLAGVHPSALNIFKALL